MPELKTVPNSNIFPYDGRDLEVTQQMKNTFDTDGFIVVKNFLSKQELDIIEEAVTGPGSLSSYDFCNEDGHGKGARLCLWSNTGNDTTGHLARTRKLAGTAGQLLGGEVYHYQSKVSMKDATTGGSFVWHQDYGYWYNRGCLFPDMMTVFMAIDRCTRDNGCLQVLKGSHLCGRIQHAPVAGQVGADSARVAELEKRLDKVYVELSPGDALFFHCNLLHTSTSNTSQHRRWAILSCYNRITNDPVVNMFARSSPLELLDNDAVMRLGVSRDLQGKDVKMKNKIKGGDYVTILQ